jgi:hypothetical protein
MPQIFHRSANTISRVSIFGAIIILAFITWALAEIQRSPYNTRALVARQQPVQFSHKHHAGDDGIDCRYCHTTVETSSLLRARWRGARLAFPDRRSETD